MVLKDAPKGLVASSDGGVTAMEAAVPTHPPVNKSPKHWFSAAETVPVPLVVPKARKRNAPTAVEADVAEKAMLGVTVTPGPADHPVPVVTVNSKTGPATLGNTKMSLGVIKVPPAE